MTTPFGLDAAAFSRSATKGAVHLRPLVGADRASWNGLWKGYLDFYETSLPQAQYDLTFRRYLDPEKCVVSTVSPEA